MKKVISLFLSVIMMISVTTGFDFLAYANIYDNYVEGEFNKKTTVKVIDSELQNCVRIEVPSSGRICVDTVENLYNEEGKKVYPELDFRDYEYNEYGSIDLGWKYQNSFMKMQFVDLNKGIYYIDINTSYCSGGKINGSFDFTMTFESANETFEESYNGNDDSFANANEIKINKTYNGFITNTDQYDYYKFTVEEGHYKLKYKSKFNDIFYGYEDDWCNFTVVNKDGEDFIEVASGYNADETGYTTGYRITYLKAGTYYLKVYQDDYDSGFYSFSLVPSGHSLDDTIHEASFTKDGEYKYYCWACNKTVSKGVIPKVSNVKLEATTLTYNGKVRTPRVYVKDSKGKALVKNKDYTVSYASGRKNVGKYAVKVTLKGNYSGTKTLYFTIKPKATSISSLSAGSKKFTVKWKKQSTQVTGYQIQYSTSSKFTSPKTVTVSSYKTTSKTISKLKGKKKYYVRVRTYKTVGKTKYYSSWSSAKSVTTKK